MVVSSPSHELSLLQLPSELTSYRVDCAHLKCQSTGPAEDKEEVQTCEEVPVDGEDGGEVVEDDPGCDDAEDTAENGQECAHLHPTGDLLQQCF